MPPICPGDWRQSEKAPAVGIRAMAILAAAGANAWTASAREKSMTASQERRIRRVRLIGMIKNITILTPQAASGKISFSADAAFAANGRGAATNLFVAVCRAYYTLDRPHCRTRLCGEAG
jgi:hypothetical protein